MPSITAEGKTIFSMQATRITPSAKIGIVYSWDPVTGYTILRQSGIDSTYTVFGIYHLNTQGNNVNNSWVNFGSTEGLYDNNDLIIAEGDIADGTNGSNFNKFYNYRVFDNDTIVFQSTTSDGNTGIWAGDVTGVKKVVQVGDIAPDIPGDLKFWRVNGLVMNRKGNIVVSDLVVNETTNEETVGIWIGGVSRPLQIVVKNDELIEVSKDSFLTVLDPWINSSADPYTGADGKPSVVNNEAEFLFSTKFTEGGNALVLAVGPGLIVNSNGDAPDVDSTDGVCFTGNTLPDGRPECTLRAAITEANNQEGPNKITFDIKEVPTIRPSSALPEIKDTLLIDGFSQPGDLDVLIDGALTGKDIDGLSLRGSGITVQGLEIGFFDRNGISIIGTREQPANNNNIFGCVLGFYLRNGNDFGNGRNGIYLNTASHNTIGGPNLWQRNYIASNIQHGISLRDSSKHNIIENNYIGWAIINDVVGNNNNGISLSYGCDSNLIGNSNGRGNVIRGNGMNGIFTQRSHDNIIEGNRIGSNNDNGIFFDYESTHNRIIRNIIGLTEVGNSDGNKLNGIYLNNNSNMNFIGGRTDSGNVISSNIRNGVLIYKSDENSIADNYVGTDFSGLINRGNKANGILLDACTLNVIGNRNIISGNDSTGVLVQNLSTLNSISGNLIGVGNDSSAVLPNLWGVTIYESPQNEVVSNLIKNSYYAGLLLLSDSSDVLYNTITYNGFAKHDSTGIYGGDGIYVNGVNNIILAPAIFGFPGKQKIAYNYGAGVRVVESANRNNYFNTIQYNQIFDNLQGGIDIDPVGVNDRDTLDADDGANSKINAPLLYSATISSANHLKIFGSILSKPNERFFYDIYGNEVCDSSGLGQGKEYLFSGFVDTDPLGKAEINYIDSILLIIPNAITMTVTDDYGNTSEFSNCAPVISSGVDLFISKNNYIDTTNIYDTLNYKIRVVNYGPESANNVIVTDSIPQFLTYLSDTVSQGSSTYLNSILTCNIGTLAPGAEALISLVTEVDSFGTIINYANVTSSSTDMNLANNIAVDTTVSQNIQTSIGDNSNNTLPDKFELAQNYPNPFNPSTSISFALPTKSNVEIMIYNALGQSVKRLVNQELSAGIHSVSWDGKNDNGKAVSSGMYLYKIIANDFVSSKKMLLLK